MHVVASTSYHCRRKCKERLGLCKRFLVSPRDGLLLRASDLHNYAVHCGTAEQRISLALLYSTVRYMIPGTSYIGACICTKCTCFARLHALLGRPRVISRALGCGARRGAACTPRRKCWSRAGSVARSWCSKSRDPANNHRIAFRLDEPRRTIETP